MREKTVPRYKQRLVAGLRIILFTIKIWRKLSRSLILYMLRPNELTEATNIRTQAHLVELFLRQEYDQPHAEWWTVQGIGMIRMYLTPDQRYRLHIWDLRHRVPDVSAIHDHPWNFYSRVIAGRVKQFRFTPWKFGQCHESYNTVEIKTGEDAKTLTETKKVLLSREPFELYVEGQVYHQNKSEIHESLADHGTVTVVERNFEDMHKQNAHIYWPGNGPWITAKPHQATPEEVSGACQLALETWF
jgi:hypothetical protein